MKRPKGITRRNFMKRGAALAGLAVAGGPSVLARGAGRQPAKPKKLHKRERRTLHFDFSPSQGGIKDLRLIALRSESHQAVLKVHTAESRQRFRKENQVLGAIPDANLTHYLEEVDLPADALQFLQVVGTDAATGQALWLGGHLHMPSKTLSAFAKRAAREGRLTLFHTKLQAYNSPLPSLSSAAGVAAALVNAADFVGPLDTAASLVFHHPEVMNLDPDQGTEILNAIHTLPCNGNDSTCQPFLYTLAFQIANKWPASTTPGGWATLVPQTHADGSPVVDENGQQIYRYELNDDIAATAASVAHNIRQDFIFDNLTFEGNNWHATEGLAQVTQPIVLQSPSGSQQLAAARVAAAQEAFSVQLTYPVGSTLHGVNFVGLDVTDPTTRKVVVQVKNRYLRFLSAYVQFLDENGPLPVADPSPPNTERSEFVRLVVTNDQLMGIPLMGDLASTQEIEFEVPENASFARVLFGSLGLGGEAFSPEAIAGSIATLAFNIGIPTILLAAGVAIDAAEGPLESIFKDEPVLLALIKSARDALLDKLPDFGEGIFSSALSSEVTPFLTGVANVVIQAILNASSPLFLELSNIIATFEIITAAPIIGIALKIVSIAADLAALAETIGEVLSSPAIFDNTVALTMDTTVTISHDPDDFRFPARASTYTVTATYDGAVPRQISGAIPPAQVDPIMATFSGVPAGGRVTFDVVLSADDGTIVGRSKTLIAADGTVVDADEPGPVGPIPNLPATASQVAITIKELLIPLTAQTQYQHDLKLIYQNGQHVWVETAAPTDTLADLCNGQPNALCSLGGITVHTRTGMAGYGFEADGLPACLGGGSGIFHTIQNIFLGQNPDRAFKQLGCGFSTPVGIVYNPLDPSPTGQHFFLQPRADGQSFDVRAVVLDTTTPLTLNQTFSWGRFTQTLDSLAVHPAGYVVGVNRQNHKMEILRLPAQVVDEAVAPTAVPFGVIKGGKGTREGLLHTPVAVTVSQGAILVLEQGNNRIQAFDVTANPVNYFFGQSSPVLKLPEEPGVVYLDLGVEAVGYLYVLSYVNDGGTLNDYRLDIYDPDGNFLTRTVGVAAARMAVDTFRNVYTLNYETIANSPRIEPSLSQWVPVTPT